MASNQSLYSDNIEDALAVHHKLAKTPTVGQAFFSSKPGDNKRTRTLELTLKSKDLENEENLQKRITAPMQLEAPQSGWRSTKIQPIPEAATTSTSLPPVPSRLDPVVAQKADTTPGSAARIVLKEIPDPKNPQTKKRFVEVFEGAVRLFSRDVTAHHRNFITDGIFGSLDIHGASRTAVYSAEANVPKDQGRFEFIDSLGEKTGNNVRPSVFLLRWAGSSGNHFHVDSFKPRKSYLFGPLILKGSIARVEKAVITQALILPEFDSGGARHIVATARNDPSNHSRLGTVYCNNRLSAIIQIRLPKIPQKPEELNPWSLEGLDTYIMSDDLAISSNVFLDMTRPREFAWRNPFVRVGKAFSDGKVTKYQQRIYMLGTEWGRAHNDYTAVGVYIYETTVQQGSKTVMKSGLFSKCGESLFQGREIENPYLYLGDEDQDGGPRVSDKDIYLVNAQRLDGAYQACAFEARMKAPSRPPERDDDYLQFDIEFSKVLLDRTPGQTEILCTDGQNLLATSFSSSRTCHMEVNVRTMLGKTAATAKPEQIYHSRQDVDDLSKLSDKVLASSRAAENERNEFLQSKFPGSLVLVPRHVEGNNKAPPTIIMPHGGPHGISTLAFSPTYSTLMLLGYQIIFPNYPGSIGKDSAYVKELLGHCGTKDINYCHDITMSFIEKGWASPKHLYVLGGSHGGFIAAHLIQKYPTLFKAAVMRNPVIDIASMAVTTDIPDWCYRELNIEYDVPAWGRVLQPKAYKRMYDASPVVGWDKVKADVLLLVGNADRRVPPQQSRMYFAALQTEEFITLTPTPTDQKTVQMLCFEDADHALETPEAQKYGFEAMLKLFDKTAKTERWRYSAFRRPGDGVATT